MSKTFTRAIFALSMLFFTASFAQGQSVTISGIIKDKATKEPMPGVGVTIKGRTTATSTNSAGRFSLSTTEKAPFTIVITYVGYTTVEKEITGSTSSLDLEIEAGVTLGQDVVISASRTPERILESPVTVERMGVNAIKEISAPSFYDALNNMKGVEISTQSLTFKSINTRGFNSNGNTRFNQYVDGMDNQAPGLNFSVGNIVGISDLDLDNVELLPGASSALYGAGGINGTMLMTSKNPFDYQGVSFQFKTGINHVNDDNTGNQEYKQLDVRMAKAWGNKFAIKGTFSFLQAQDWQADNYNNFDRTSRTVKSGNRVTDPNYDGVNVYGDETNSNILSVSRSLQQGFAAASPAGFAAFNNLIGSGASYANLVTAINTNPVYATLRPALPYLGVLYSLNKNTTSSQDVSRTGYNEANLVDYDTESMKMSGSMHYRFSPTIEAIAQLNWGTGTSVYTGSDRYSLRNFNIGQYKLELKGQDFFVRAYTTQERSGDSYISSILGSFINEAYKPSVGPAANPTSGWFAQYALAYSTARAQGATDEVAHNAARGVADQGRLMPGTTQFNTVKNGIANATISSGQGAKFDDKTNLYHYEGMYNLSNALNNVFELQVGGSYRIYQLRSGGTIFDDLTRDLNIDEYGAYAQLSKKLFQEKFKLSVSGRYDKSTNFDGRFTPRISGVFTVAPNNNIRVSYQTGYRNPTTQNQYIDLSVAGGRQRLIGGLPESLNKYNLFTNKPYTDASYRAYLTSVSTGAPNRALLQTYDFDARGVRPESVQAYEVGYKGLLGPRFLIDTYAYYNTYKDFITAVDVYQENPANNFPKFGVPVNAKGEVTSYGAALGIDYLMGDYNVSGNVSYNEIGDLPAEYINDFNTPKVRYNLGLGNKEVIKNIGFNVNYRWQDGFYWNSSFSSGEVPSFSTLDAQINLKIPSVKSMIKVGGSNILNKYYFTSYGNPSVGALYYIGFTYNP
ncbi:TonB-dependent receptor [Pedobacter metabolipauper]|uniref:TonB-dependent receptor-like protein n=1 Tax=Pedobacter metabolipauper TaxID=425513 RepID=A0A4R6SV26_9SPHI|nr:TonB-dependent receptor [Pedobacter metabolipauper]TDQ08600.1 TonB-dependent receptor-like protein [Pedobacter metabolipauper]